MAHKSTMNTRMLIKLLQKDECLLGTILRSQLPMEQIHKSFGVEAHPVHLYPVLKDVTLCRAAQNVVIQLIEEENMTVHEYIRIFEGIY